MLRQGGFMGALASRLALLGWMASTAVPVLLHPNPFRNTVTFSFQRTREGPVTARVFDLAGREVFRSRDDSSARESTLSWNGCDLGGRELPSGVYVLRVEMGEQVLSRRLCKLR
jgi:hypothetical protein